MCRWPIAKVGIEVTLDVVGMLIPPFKGTDILYLRLLGTDMVVLNSNEAISDLIEKRSSIYADRVSDGILLTFLFLTPHPSHNPL